VVECDSVRMRTYLLYLLTYLLTYNYLGDASPVGSASPAAPGLPREPRGLDSRVPECSDCEYSDSESSACSRVSK
jgi:hypothetical protein